MCEIPIRDGSPGDYTDYVISIQIPLLTLIIKFCGFKVKLYAFRHYCHRGRRSGSPRLALRCWLGVAYDEQLNEYTS